MSARFQMPDMWLTREQLEELTGYKRLADIRRWLTARGYRYDEARNGIPKVLIEQVRQRQLAAVEDRRGTPNVAGLRAFVEKSRGRGRK